MKLISALFLVIALAVPFVANAEEIVGPSGFKGVSYSIAKAGGTLNPDGGMMGADTWASAGAGGVVGHTGSLFLDGYHEHYGFGSAEAFSGGVIWNSPGTLATGGVLSGSTAGVGVVLP